MRSADEREALRSAVEKDLGFEERPNGCVERRVAFIPFGLARLLLPALRPIPQESVSSVDPGRVDAVIR
jgi:hypothetical protein